jgi:hypothetical protein
MIPQQEWQGMKVPGIELIVQRSGKTNANIVGNEQGGNDVDRRQLYDCLLGSRQEQDSAIG